MADSIPNIHLLIVVRHTVDGRGKIDCSIITLTCTIVSESVIANKGQRFIRIFERTIDDCQLANAVHGGSHDTNGRCIISTVSQVISDCSFITAINEGTLLQIHILKST